MKVLLRPHLRLGIKERLIPQTYPQKIVKFPESKFQDVATNHLIAIKSLEYNGKVRPMVVSYDIINEQIQVITIYPTTLQEVENRIKSKRWVKL